MKSWKTTIAGLAAGLPLIIQALLEAYNSGQFTGKNVPQTILGVAIIVLGFYSKDKNVTGGTKPQ